MKRITDCSFTHDEMYHIGKRLWIWLRHEFCRGGYLPKVDRGGWVQVNDIINEKKCWESVYFEFQKHSLHQYRAEPGARVCYDSKDMAEQTLPDVDELMRNRTSAMTLAASHRKRAVELGSEEQEDGICGSKTEAQLEQPRLRRRERHVLRIA